tara:strand:+ start:27320 stop:27919 length:600 start_codon:yes stop_codon:yes gene_type:complete
MKKTGLIFLALAGISIAFLWKPLNSGQSRPSETRSATQQQSLLLQQIPARLASNLNSTGSQNQSVTGPQKSETESSLSIAGFSSDEILARLVGKWEQTKSTSRQILTIDENGTATMVIEPQGIWTAVLGKKVTVNIEWSLNAGKLTLRTVGGSPENKLQYINQLWGSEFVREIHTIEDKMFTLRDNKGDVSQKWIRTAY